MSRLVYQATGGAGVRVYAAACALVEADQAYPGLAARRFPTPGIAFLGLSTALAPAGDAG
ncbi:hypothetical protein IAG44_32710 [Streptomyces roseirectus]|uniref:Uncharacterized protein n=1 Tax=Streptomyces roseirectus TaxID=2768066 RepID=A0A7H0ILU0_9ACTN|nr:hypothetical protein [Streptomyces roseirectus]QNP73756.1 hypothetical protein IAG44_32710 [Streptomyces roseirectus]